MLTPVIDLRPVAAHFKGHCLTHHSKQQHAPHNGAGTGRAAVWMSSKGSDWSGLGRGGSFERLVLRCLHRSARPLPRVGEAGNEPRPHTQSGGGDMAVDDPKHRHRHHQHNTPPHEQLSPLEPDGFIFGEEGKYAP